MAKAVREADGKAILASYFNVLRAEAENGAVGKTLQFPLKSATVRHDTDFSKLVKEHPWLETEVKSHACSQRKLSSVDRFCFEFSFGGSPSLFA
jgi:hypothetical protein